MGDLAFAGDYDKAFVQAGLSASSRDLYWRTSMCLIPQQWFAVFCLTIAHCGPS